LHLRSLSGGKKVIVFFLYFEFFKLIGIGCGASQTYILHHGVSFYVFQLQISPN